MNGCWKQGLPTLKNKILNFSLLYVKVDRFLRHLFVSAMFDIFLFLATAISLGFVAYSLIQLHVVIILFVIVVSSFFIIYKVYSAYYVDYAEYKVKLAHEISEVETEIIMLRLNLRLIKDKPLSKIILKEIKKKEAFIKELKNYK